MSTTPDPNTFLLGGGGKSATFPQIGATVTGKITQTPEVKQKTKMGSGDLEFWDNGDPKLQLVVTLQTDLRDPADDDDDGIRKLYVAGSKKPESKSMHAAVAAAVQNAKASGLEIGGTLTVRYISDGKSNTPGFNPPKQYDAHYVPAAADFLGTTPAVSAAPLAPLAPPPIAPAAAQPAAAAPPAMTQEQLAAYHAYVQSQQQSA
jgi:hypothetical protein